jgi:glycosyltransferase involved in cell wall biosynthesis
MPLLSVVLISKNQEGNIARLIESVLRGTAFVPSREIILVDSASSDKTVEIASRYPITVLRLHSDQHLSSHAGRYTGYLHTSGEFVLFLDGDMELEDSWMAHALPIMQRMPEVGAITGPRIDLPVDSGPEAKPPFVPPAEDIFDDIDHGGGAAMYRHSVLEQVGPFNPYLHSDGEPELCIRIRHAGYRVIRLERLMIYHYSPPEWDISTIRGRHARKLYIGYGQATRYHLGTEMFWPYVRERGYVWLPIAGILSGLLSIILSLKSRRWLWIQVWLLLFLTFFAGQTYRKRSINRAAAGLVSRSLMLDGFIKGFVMPVRRPESYPARVDVIRRQEDPAEYTMDEV